jgi:hypothetical protein
MDSRSVRVEIVAQFYAPTEINSLSLFRPFGADGACTSIPTAYAVGCILSPLRGPRFAHGADKCVCVNQSALRSRNFLVAVRPSKFAWTSSEESGSSVSSTSILISAAPPESATACV